MNAVKWFCGGLDSLRVRLEIALDERQAEDELLSLAGGDFLFALKDILRELTERTRKPYADYLEEAKQMILAGSHPSDVIYHYAILAYRSEERDYG